MEKGHSSFITRVCGDCGAHHSRSYCPICMESRTRGREARNAASSIKYVVLVCILMWLILIVLFLDARAEDYSVTGRNLVTGERVLGFLHVDGEGQAKGYVFDQFYRFDIVGNATGRGVFYAEGAAFHYELEVIE